jgi:hypothetical protein
MSPAVDLLLDDGIGRVIAVLADSGPMNEENSSHNAASEGF